MLSRKGRGGLDASSSCGVPNAGDDPPKQAHRHNASALAPCQSPEWQACWPRTTRTSPSAWAGCPEAQLCPCLDDPALAQNTFCCGATALLRREPKAQGYAPAASMLQAGSPSPRRNQSGCRPKGVGHRTASTPSVEHEMSAAWQPCGNWWDSPGSATREGETREGARPDMAGETQTEICTLNVVEEGGGGGGWQSEAARRHPTTPRSDRPQEQGRLRRAEAKSPGADPGSLDLANSGAPAPGRRRTGYLAISEAPPLRNLANARAAGQVLSEI